MRFTIAAVGRMRNGIFHDLYQHYAKRVNWALMLHEIDAPSARSASERKSSQSKMLLSKIPAAAIVLALDENGTMLSSYNFGHWVKGNIETGVRDICIVIGGADGLHKNVLSRADFILSLGKITLPHLLVRGIFVEQLYRAQQILSGHPYHRE